MIPEATIDHIVETIVGALSPQRIILFGSHANGTPDEDSDLDLLVIADMQESPPRRAARIYSLFDPYPCAMDILVYTPAEVERYRNWRSLVLRKALEEGEVLYERESS